MLRGLFRFEGRVQRGEYVVSAVLLVALKYIIDASIAAHFGEHWQITNYVLPPRNLWTLGIGAGHPTMFLLLWAVAIPFFWLGISLTLRRLRDAGRRAGWVFLFFVPVLNFALFLSLSCAPTAMAAAQEYAAEHDADLDEGVPDRSRLRGGAIAGLAVALVLGTLFAVFSSGFLAQYAWGLFLGVPFLSGFVAGWFFNAQVIQSKGETVAVSCLVPVLIGFALLCFRAEGLICLLMAIPLAVPFCIAGGLTARHCLMGRRRGIAPPSLSACVAILPLAMLGEHFAAPQPPVEPVVTSIIVNAPVDTVWQNVIAFPPLAPPDEWLFHTGIAYPIGATITALPGKELGVGSIRRCRFSTGDFVEPITVWNRDHLLAFNVTEEPPSLREIGFGALHTPHIDLNYMRSQHGQFKLIALDAHHTLLEGTTWYQDYFWPQAYWRPISDAIVHRIHMRVLEHVKQQAEAAS